MCEREATKAIHRGHPTMMSTRCHQVRHGRPQAFTAQLLLLLSAANDYVGGGSRLLQPAPGSESTLVDLLSLRRQYRRSFPFVIRCLPTLARLHFRTARDD